MKHVLGYVRVSTDEQAHSGTGLLAQRAAIQAEADRRGWPVIDVIEDAGYSGKSLKRPGIAKVLDDLNRGRADALVVAKLDRLSRSMLDFSGLMERATREHWALVALDVGVDTSTPQGEMIANVMAVFAQFERRLIGQRTRESLAIRRRQGLRLGRPSQLPAEVQTLIRSHRADGSSLSAIADFLNADGVATAHGGARWYPSTVSKVLGSKSEAQ